MTRHGEPFHESGPTSATKPLTRADVARLASAMVGAIESVTQPEPTPEPTAAELAAMSLEDGRNAMNATWANRFEQAGPLGAQAALAHAWGDFTPRAAEQPGA